MKVYLLIIGFLYGLTGCGYQIIGGDKLLGHSEITITTIQEPSVIGITTLLTRHLEERLLEQGLKVVPDDATAPLKLVIELKHPRTSATVISSIDRGIPTYRESLTLIASIQDTANGNTQWSVRLSQEELFRQETNNTDDAALLTEAGRRRALDRMARQFALELSNRMLLASLPEDKAE